MGTILCEPLSSDRLGILYPIHGLINEQLDAAKSNAVFVNAGSLGLRGVEFALSRSLPRGPEGTVSYSFQEATDTSTHIPETNAPRHLAQASLSLPLVKQKVFASMDLQYVSKRVTLDGLSSGAYIVPNFTLFARDISKKWEFSASLYNAFDRRYADPSGNGLAQDTIVQNGRSFRIKVGYKFQ